MPLNFFFSEKKSDCFIFKITYYTYSIVHIHCTYYTILLYLCLINCHPGMKRIQLSPVNKADLIGKVSMSIRGKNHGKRKSEVGQKCLFLCLVRRFLSTSCSLLDNRRPHLLFLSCHDATVIIFFLLISDGWRREKSRQASLF